MFLDRIKDLFYKTTIQPKSSASLSKKSAFDRLIDDLILSLETDSLWIYGEYYCEHPTNPFKIWTANDAYGLQLFEPGAGVKDESIPISRKKKIEIWEIIEKNVIQCEIIEKKKKEDELVKRLNNYSFSNKKKAKVSSLSDASKKETSMTVNIEKTNIGYELSFISDKKKHVLISPLNSNGMDMVMDKDSGRIMWKKLISDGWKKRK